MTEAEFWLCLERLLSHGCAGLPRKQRGEPALFCDGVYPELFVLGEPTPQIIGRALIGNNSFHEWKFELLLPTHCSVSELIDWQNLLPNPRKNGWLTIHESAKHFLIDLREN